MSDNTQEYILYIVSHLDHAENYIGPIKIGVTGNRSRRLQDLKCGNPQRISFYATFPFDTEEDAYEAEKNIHAMLADYRLSGEWFDFKPQKVVPAVISQMCNFAKRVSMPFTDKEVLSPNMVSAEAMIEGNMALVETTKDAVIDEGQLCLNHLLSFPTDFCEHGGRLTIGQLIQDAVRDKLTSGDVKVKQLAGYGVRCAQPKKGWGPPKLFIAYDVAGIRSVFASTRWAGGAWVQTLDRIAFARPGGSHKFAGINSRSTELPIDCVAIMQDGSGSSLSPSKTRQPDGDFAPMNTIGLKSNGPDR